MSQKMEQQPVSLREKASEIFSIAKRVAGKAETEIFLFSRIDEYLRFGNNELAQSQYSTSRDLSVRVASDKKQGRVTTGTLDKASIEKTVEKALSQARMSPEDPDYLPMPGPQKYRPVNRHSEKTVEAPAELKAGFIGSAIDLAKKNHLLASGVLGTSAEQVFVLNTSGLEASYRGTSGYFSLTMDADNGNQTGYALSTFGDIGELDPDKVSQTALERAKLNKNQAEIAPGKFDIVVDPNAWSEMLLYFAVSASTGFSPDLGMRQYKEGRSYLSGRLGEKVLGENVSIDDDVYHPDQAGPPFDGEGCAKSPVTIFENGVFRNTVSSRISQHRYGATPTGHELPLPNPLGELPSNLVIRGRGATKTTEELIGELDKGLLITRFWYNREVDPKTKTVTGMTRDGTFLVENGEIKRPVKNLRFNQSILELFSKIDAFSEPVRNFSEFQQFKILQPGILARDFNFTSVSPF
ncbi:MAG TPA: TldD/PmbA family protein [Candidatus Bathyarchaeia archaeon]|jgi:predicted Zn-dependent protease|nr:TldD/PmbA family protein [Candidatus Bathyarchaeia archaeon]